MKRIIRWVTIPIILMTGAAAVWFRETHAFGSLGNIAIIPVIFVATITAIACILAVTSSSTAK